MRRSRRRNQSAEAETTRPSRRHVGPTRPYLPLGDAEADKIINTAISLIATSGVVFEPGSEADDLLRSAGCKFQDDGVVLIPEAVTKEALKTVARHLVLWDRNGDNPVHLDCEHTLFMPGMTCIGVFDEQTGEPRASDREDLARITRLADGLENIDAVCIAAKNIAQSNLFGEIDEFVCMMENTTKPLEYLCEHPVSLDAVIEIATELRGSGASLREKPYFLHLVTPLPVNFAHIHIEQIITAARAGIPVGVGTLPIGGASSPITMSGCMTHALMTDLAAMVLGQLAAKGSFCIGCSDVAFMEPATGAIGSFSQTSLADAAICQVRHKLGIPPLTGMGGCSVAQRFNRDAVWELSATMMQMFYSRPATCDYLGSLDQGLTYSEHALLFCEDMAGLLRKMWEGVGVTDEQIGTELINELGPRGQFLASRHTVDNCRTQVWNSRYFAANYPLSNNGLSDKDLLERLDEDLAMHQQKPAPEPPADHVMVKARKVLSRFS